MPPRRPARRSGIPRIPAFSSFARFAKARAKPRRRGSCLTEHRPKSSGEKFVESKKRDVRESSENSLKNEEDVIIVDVDFFDPKPSDFHGVKNLLRTYLDLKQWDLSGFVDLILGQATVGTVVKINGDDDNLFAVITALNMARYKDHKCIVELKEFLLQICHDIDVRTCLRTILEEHAQDVGLLVSPRVANLPLEVLPELYKALFDEISWATEDEPTEELKKSFCFKYYLIVTRFYKKKTGQSNRMGNDQNEDSVIYVKLDDEIFHKLCSWSFTFPTEQIVANELKNYTRLGLVMLVESEKIPAYRDELKSLITGP